MTVVEVSVLQGRRRFEAARATRAEIDLQALRTNFRLVRRIVGCRVGVLSVVKADAYGHGAVAVSKVLVEEGTEMLGVATLGEASELRDAGIEVPLLLLGGIYPDEAGGVVELSLTPALFSLEVAERLDRAAARYGRRVKYHLKVDTGMNRLGIRPEDLDSFLVRLRGYRHIEMEGVFSHLADADLPGGTESVERQLEVFDAVLARVERAGFRPRYRHIANSAALQRFPSSHYNLVRPGIMLYGASAACGFELRPVMTLKSRVLQVKAVPAGAAVSYGGTFVAARPSVLAILPVGYADGYMRALSNRAWVTVRETRAPVVGAVCMDLTLVDVTGVEGVSCGDEAVLFGAGGPPVDELARLADTISYELLSIVGKRVPRHYVRRQEA